MLTLKDSILNDWSAAVSVHQDQNLLPQEQFLPDFSRPNERGPRPPLTRTLIAPHGHHHQVSTVGLQLTLCQAQIQLQIGEWDLYKLLELRKSWSQLHLYLVLSKITSENKMIFKSKFRTSSEKLKADISPPQRHTTPAGHVNHSLRNSI